MPRFEGKKLDLTGLENTNDVLIPAVDDMLLEREKGYVNQPVNKDNDNQPVDKDNAKQEVPSVTTSQPPSHEPSPIPDQPKRAIKPSAYVN